MWWGTDNLGRSILAALFRRDDQLASVARRGAVGVPGVSVGLLAGYRGGWIDSC
jgi:ABC-type dipeptide/oligopeptide/nickel transport system permease subunit